MSSNGGGSPVDRLRADLDELVAVDVVGLPDAMLRSGLQVLMAARNQLDAAIASWLASFDTRNLADDDACRTSAVWLRGYARCSDHAASGQVKRARLLHDLPAVAQAAGRGEVSAEHVDRIAELAKQIGVEAVQPADQILADAAATVSVAELKQLCQRIRDFVDPDGPEPMEAFERRELTISKLRGMIMLRGQLDPEGGAAVQEALDALMRPPAPDDLRTPGQRRADALVDLARRALAHGDLPTVGGMRPQVGILLSPSTLLYGEDGTDPHTRMHAPYARRHRRPRHRPPLRPRPQRRRGRQRARRRRGNSRGDGHGGNGRDGDGDGSEGAPQTTPAGGDPANPAAGAEQAGHGKAGEAGTRSRREHTDATEADQHCGPAPPTVDPAGNARGDPPQDGDTTGNARGDPPEDGDTTGKPTTGPAPPADPLAPLGIPPPVDAWLNWYGPIPPAVAKRLVCDSDLWRIVLDPATGLPLDVGRAHRLVPWWIRRALYARDRGCRWPGCTTPAAWTDAHHLNPWHVVHRTRIDELVLLCRFHHVCVHEGRWGIHLDPTTGQVSVTRPDGTPHDLQPTRPWTTPTTRSGDPPDTRRGDPPDTS